MGPCCRGFGEFLERPEDFLGPGASFCSSGLSLVYGFRGGLSFWAVLILTMGSEEG